MLKPSYAELMDILNKDNEEKNVKSRYTIVIAAAKRARQLIDGDEPMIDNIKVDKPVTIAVEELRQGKIEIVPEGQGTVLNLRKKQEEPQITEKHSLEPVTNETQEEIKEMSESGIENLLDSIFGNDDNIEDTEDMIENEDEEV